MKREVVWLVVGLVLFGLVAGVLAHFIGYLALG